MKLFTIDETNHVTVCDSPEEVQANASVAFATEEEFSEMAAAWPVSRLVAIWNTLPGVTAVTRFTDRATAVRRIWRAIEAVGHGGAKQCGAILAKHGRGKAGRLKDSAKAAGQKTKTAKVIALLRNTDGATLQAITKATGWQAHSVRGFISGTLVKKMGLRVNSIRREGQRIYSL